MLGQGSKTDAIHTFVGGGPQRHEFEYRMGVTNIDEYVIVELLKSMTGVYIIHGFTMLLLCYSF